MPAIKGFPSSQKGISPPKLSGLDENDFRVHDLYVTIQDIGSDRSALDVLPKAIFPVASFTLDAASDDRILTFGAAHGARKGDVIRFTSGALINLEVGVHSVLSATTLLLTSKLSSTSSGLDVTVMRYLTLTLDSTGSLITTPGPMSYIRDTVTTSVEEDTATPANNRALPAHSFFTLDGVQVPVVEDTGTPANNTPLPVKLTSVTGDINITAGDLNVQTTHLGVNADSMRIGNGVNEMGVNASLEALTHDADALTELQLLVAAQRLSIVDLMDAEFLDAGTIPQSSNGTGLTVVAASAAIIQKVQTIEDIGEFIGLYSNPSTVPVLICILPIAGGEVEVNIPAGTELGLQNMKDVDIILGASSIAINFLG